TQAWETALALQFRRWADRVDKQEVTLGDLPALHRSAYGAAARSVAGVLRSLAGRHGVPLS
ncbi:MAG TPA: nucleotidyltransferase, partial [Corynebacterium sp.]|nr:nucleotidyltransferase [Corynebacterium sp.]